MSLRRLLLPTRALQLRPLLLLPRSTTTTTRRTLHTTSPHLLRKSNKEDNNPPEPGKFARTDPSIRTAYPEDESQLPRSTLATSPSPATAVPTLPSFSLQGKVCVVTGGARGLGLVMGQGIVLSGADLAIVDLDQKEASLQASEILNSFAKAHPNARKPKITTHHCDVSSPPSVKSCVAEILNAHNNKIDGLVTSAGIVENVDAVDYGFDRVKRLWGVNVDGTWLFATEVGRHLLQRKAKGSMVFIGSMSGSIVNVPQPQAPYNASKAAVRHLAASLSVEWARDGIRVNCVSPGYMLTALTKKILDGKPDLKQQWTSLIPQGRMGNPEDLMGPVTFLLSDASSYVTGADLRVDGGYTLT
ncbi:hypothetical protein QBC44DRAFT_323754 [Cladorrhinum sp. PSN332]|nr:hypothetical protein QBC44DRAFT_323754 [Cladorrhinum sp. PSN332]